MAAVATAAPTVASAHPFTCNTCQVAFRSGELQRTHMQSDWHRYNLKRRVASLPPLTSEIFAEKVLANKASAAATAARASFEKTCPACSKTYYSENAYQNHVGSQKHKLQVLKLQARRTAAEGLETDSMISSTFSLGDPLETESAMSTNEQGDTTEVTQRLHQAELLNDSNEPQAAVTKSETSAESEDEDMEDEEETEVALNECLFCNIPQSNVESNVKHMAKQHGMFIPERDYLVDLKGLLTHLHEVIFDLHQCLTCRHVKHTVSGIQTHMRDRGHCMIPYTTESDMLDIGEYYDFRSTYSDGDDDDEMEDDDVNGGVKLGVARKVKTVVANGDGGEDEVLVDDDEEGWESDASSLSSVPTDEITAMPIDDHSHRYKTLNKHRHHSHDDPRPHRNTDGFHSHAHPTPRAVYYDEYELHLPSGRTAGHRSLNKYYRQNLHSRPSASEQAERRLAIENGEVSEDDAPTPRAERDRGRQLISKATRDAGMVGVTDAKKREIRAVEKRTQKIEQRARNRYQAGNEKRNNHQKHFRDPLLQ